ncbi:MAG: hypothetical protein IKE01_00055 [Clostridia bacterium]|nr:hypothetical protein [Clostridia bacterium]
MRRLKLSKILLITLVILTAMSFSGKAMANTVEYKGGADGLITAPDDFFSNFDTLMPGDTEEDVAYIKNSTNDKIEVFFRTEPLDRSQYYDDIDYSLLDKITLKISLKRASASEEQILYDGNLGAEQMSEFISLGEYEKGFDGEFKFKIEVPTSLRNSYTLSRTKVKWIFAVEKKEEEKKEDKENEEKQEDNSNANSAKTGDNIIIISIALGVAMIICIIVVILKKKSSKKDENNK